MLSAILHFRTFAFKVGEASRPSQASAPPLRRLMRSDSGQSLAEVAVCTPVFLLLIFYAVNFGYYFIVAAALTSSARNAAEYAIQGFASPAGAYSTPSLPAPPPAGAISVTNSVAALALRDINSLVSSSTKTTVQVCSNTVGSTRTVSCQSWGATTQTWTPDADPESNRFQLFRVDVQYTISPPIPATFMGYNLVPTYTFHRMAEMRGMN
jgi:Flp pilus assembly protein TadG